MKILVKILLGLGVLALLVRLGGALVFDQPAHEYQAVSEEQKQAAEGYLAAGLEPMPAGWQNTPYVVEDDVALEAGFLEVPNAKGTVIIVPGYTAPIELYSYAINRFAQAGYHVAALSYRGQGRSPRTLDDPEKGFVADYAILARDLAGFVKQIQEQFSGPIMVFGNSKGGHISLRLAGDIGPNVNAYALLAPMVKIYTGNFPYWFASGLSQFYTATGLGESYAAGQKQWQVTTLDWQAPTQCNSRADRAHLRDAMFALHEELRVEGTTFQWVASTVASTALLQSKPYQAKLNKPFLFVTAGKDTIVDSAAASQMCKALSQCTELQFSSARHCMDRERDEDRDVIYDAIIAHYDSHL